MGYRLATIAVAFTLGVAAHAAPPDPPPIVPALGLPSATPALTKQQVKAQQVRIEEQYDQSQARCRKLQGPARELCREQARGERDVQSAELQMRAEPSADNDQKIRLARAEAAHAMAMVKCRTFDGAARSVCRQEARALLASARTDARLQKEVVAQALRSEQIVRERTAQAERVAEAQFKAARERCELLPGEGRENCLADAKKRFGKT